VRFPSPSVDTGIVLAPRSFDIRSHGFQECAELFVTWMVPSPDSRKIVPVILSMYGVRGEGPSRATSSDKVKLHVVECCHRGVYSLSSLLMIFLYNSYRCFLFKLVWWQPLTPCSSFRLGLADTMKRNGENRLHIPGARSKSSLRLMTPDILDQRIVLFNGGL
jgi:hypothetical protein